MKTLRLFFYFLIGFFLSACAVLSYAQTPSSIVAQSSQNHIAPQSGASASLASIVAGEKSWYGNSGYGTCTMNTSGWNIAGRPGWTEGYTCGASGFAAWITWNCPATSTAVQGATPACVCPNNGVWNSTTNTCGEPPPCDTSKSGSAQVWANAWAIAPANGYNDGSKLIGPKTVPSSGCDTSAGCTVTNESFQNCIPSGNPSVDVPAPIYCTLSGHYSGGHCSSNAAPSTPPQTSNHPPKCLATEGVLTTSSGTVACVPSGTPSAQTPLVNTTNKTSNYGDGSSKVESTTTTTDPNTGATNQQTTTTTTGAGGSSTGSGQAGTAGTSTSGSNSSNSSGTPNQPAPKDQQGDCKLEPDAPFCKPWMSPGTEGLYQKKDKEFKQPLTDFANGIKNSTLGNTATGFFTVSVPAGSCPASAVNVPYLNMTIDATPYLCSSTAMQIMDIIGTVLLFIAAYRAFGIAFL